MRDRKPCRLGKQQQMEHNTMNNVTPGAAKGETASDRITLAKFRTQLAVVRQILVRALHEVRVGLASVTLGMPDAGNIW